MNVLVYLIPVALLLGLVGLAGFFWMLKNGQFEDPEGQAARILSGRYDDAPADDPTDAPADTRARARGPRVR